DRAHLVGATLLLLPPAACATAAADLVHDGRGGGLRAHPWRVRRGHAGDARIDRAEVGADAQDAPVALVRLGRDDLSPLRRAEGAGRAARGAGAARPDRERGG